jgi:hypothetical protein
LHFYNSIFFAQSFNNIKLQLRGLIGNAGGKLYAGVVSLEEILFAIASIDSTG